MLDTLKRQLTIQTIQSRKEGGVLPRLALLYLGQGGPQRNRETFFDAPPVVNALVKQIAEIEHQQADQHAQRQRQENHQQTLGKNPARVERRMLDDGDVADAAVVQLPIDAGFFQTLVVEREVSLCGVQHAL